MCGLTGLFDPFGQDVREHVQSMSGTLVHRGPDDSGAWSDPEQGIALGFRRLSILDLTQDGHQPMHSPLGRYVIGFNGEVYNHADIRATLEQVAPEVIGRTRGHSDTATMLAAFDVWGITASLQRFAGMFAMAVWDRQERMLTLVRDRIGEKPLYYGWLTSGGFVFGSELKSLRAHPDFNTELSIAALNVYFRRAFIPAPLSIYEGVYKLVPGTTLTLSAEDIAQKQLPEPEPYWSLEEVARIGLENRDENLSDEGAVRQFDHLLREVVQREMVADVPLGAFLSGGVDSSLVVAIMQQLASQPVKTFSIGFENQRFNEAPYAAAVAKHLETDHTEQYVTDQDAMNVIPLLPSIYDEPFADSSQIPTYLVSKIAREEVSVSLTGDGGDEIFGGYNSYVFIDALWGKLTTMPRQLRGLVPFAAKGVKLIPFQARLLKLASHLSIFSTSLSDPTRIYRLASSIGPDSMGLDLYKALVLGTETPLIQDLDARRFQPQFSGPSDGLAKVLPAIEAMMFWDTLGALPDDMLVKVDRAAMAVSLETRAPLLDHTIIEAAWSLRPDMKLRAGKSKWILRRLLSELVPNDLIDRPKQGFGIPVRHWLTGPLADWVEGSISADRLTSGNVLDPEKVRLMWDDYKSNGSTTNAEMWSILMFQEWLDHNGTL